MVLLAFLGLLGIRRLVIGTVHEMSALLYLQIPWNRLYTSRIRRQTGCSDTLRTLYSEFKSCRRGQRHVTLVRDVGSKNIGHVPISRMHFDECAHAPLGGSLEVWGYGESMRGRQLMEQHRG